MSSSRLQDADTGNQAQPTTNGSVEFGPRREMRVDLSANSLAFKTVYSSRNALTLFCNQGAPCENAIEAMKSQDCIGKIRFGKHFESIHASWHHTLGDIMDDHYHVMKGNRALVTPEEIRCLILNIKSAEKNEGVCKDGKTQCLISSTDAKKILKRYEEAYPSWDKNTPIEKVVEFELKQYAIAGANTFTLAFVSTLIDKYLQPYALQNGLQQNYAEALARTADSICMLILGGSATSIIFNSALRYIIQPLLVNAGMNEKITSQILIGINAIHAFTQNPLSLAEIGVNGTAAMIGQSAAYGIIRKLPKLREEPAVNTPEVEVAEVVRDEIPGLRRR